MADGIVRLYNMEDELMLTRSQTQKDAATGDLAAFTARIPWFTAIYLTSYQTDIDTADAFPEDATVMTDVKVLTADVNASVEEGKGNLRNLFLYSEITYPDDKVRQRVFGQDRMHAASSDQEKMKNLLEHAHSFASKDPYKTALQDNGYTEVATDALLTVADNIHEKNRLQENAKNSRPVTTQDRVIVYNTVFSRMKLVYKCAQIVFAGNPAKIAQYRVYPPHTPGAVTTAHVHVTNLVTGVNMGGLTVAIPDSDMHDTTNDGGMVAFTLGTSPGDIIAFTVSGADITTQTFEGLTLIEGEDNVFEIQVTV